MDFKTADAVVTWAEIVKELTGAEWKECVADAKRILHARALAGKDMMPEGFSDAVGALTRARIKQENQQMQALLVRQEADLRRIDQRNVQSGMGYTGVQQSQALYQPAIPVFIPTPVDAVECKPRYDPAPSDYSSGSDAGSGGCGGGGE